jgi:choline dehydrogenase-like flavoprotein
VSAVESLRVRTLQGKEYRVKARCYVLACCTIQNARLLLASNRRATAGLGNSHDLVGRYFMEHLEMPAGELVLEKPESTKTKMYAIDFGVTKARAELSLSAQAQRKHGILNGTASLEPGVVGVCV